MIREIYSSAFKQNTVVFKKGLNVVLGNDKGANSIGKSTMLLVIDYMFGGEHYQTKTEIIANVGHHIIGAKFEFNGELFCFTRDTRRSDTVTKCDNHYQPIEDGEITLDEYKCFLQEKYGLNIAGCTLRTFIGLFSRIYDRNNYNEKLPLNEHSESMESSVERLVKIFELYKEIAELRDNLKEAKERNNAYNKVIKLDLINSAKNKREASIIKKRIESIEQEIQILTIEISTNTASLDTNQLETILKIKERLSKLQDYKSRVHSKIVRYENDIKATNRNTTIDLALVKKFFPTANILEISKLNQFHENLCKILSDDLQNQITNLQLHYDKADEEEKKLITSIKDVVSETNPTKLAVANLVEKQMELYKLMGATSSFDKKNSYQKEMKNAQDLLDETLQKILTGIQQTLNAKIAEYNDFVYNKTKKEPLLTLQPNKYIYDCSDDGGTGSRYSSLVLFDLSILAQTKLPIICHDSLIFKNIEDDAIDKILKLYEGFIDKQIFISFDKKTAYNNDVIKILVNNKILELAPGGKELYGKSWSRK